MNLFSQIRSTISSPDKIFLETGAGATISYGDMLARSAQIANVLAARGVKPGDRVAVQVEKTPENLLLYLAALRAGAVYLPLNTAYTLAELDYFIGDAEHWHYDSFRISWRDRALGKQMATFELNDAGKPRELRLEGLGVFRRDVR